MKKKRTPEQREAMKVAYEKKWGGGDEEKVIRTKGITNDVWNVTPSEFDNGIMKVVK